MSGTNRLQVDKKYSIRIVSVNCVKAGDPEKSDFQLPRRKDGGRAAYRQCRSLAEAPCLSGSLKNTSRHGGPPSSSLARLNFYFLELPDIFGLFVPFAIFADFAFKPAPIRGLSENSVYPR